MKIGAFRGLYATDQELEILLATTKKVELSNKFVNDFNLEASSIGQRPEKIIVTRRAIAWQATAVEHLAES